MYPACKAHAPHCTVICNLSGCNIFFHIISKTARISEKKVIENKMCVWIFSTSLTEIFHIIRKTERDLIINLHTSSCQVPATLVGFELNFNFLDRFSKKTQIKNCMRVHPVGDELFHNEGQTDGRTDIVVGRRTDRHDEVNSRVLKFY